MAIEQAKTREFMGHDRSGNPFFSTTFESGPRAPETVGEWLQQRRAALYPWTSHRHVAVALELLEQAAAGNGGAAAVKAAGKDLTPVQQYDAGQLLGALEQQAHSGYAPAIPVTRRVAAAWVKCYGDQPPKPAPGSRIGGDVLPAAGTGAVKMGPWYAPAGGAA